MSDTRPFTVASFNRFLDEKKLMASRCPACDALYLPPRAICPACHGDGLQWAELSGRGRLAAFTSIYVAPTLMLNEGFDRDKPYCTGIVELEAGVRISARILGVDPASPDVIQIGLPMTVEYLERGEGDEKRTFLAFTA